MSKQRTKDPRPWRVGKDYKRKSRPKTYESTNRFWRRWSAPQFRRRLIDHDGV